MKPQWKFHSQPALIGILLFGIVGTCGVTAFGTEGEYTGKLTPKRSLKRPVFTPGESKGPLGDRLPLPSLKLEAPSDSLPVPNEFCQLTQSDPGSVKTPPDTSTSPSAPTPQTTQTAISPITASTTATYANAFTVPVNPPAASLPDIPTALEQAVLEQGVLVSSNSTSSAIPAAPLPEPVIPVVEASAPSNTTSESPFTAAEAPIIKAEQLRANSENNKTTEPVESLFDQESSTTAIPASLAGPLPPPVPNVPTQEPLPAPAPFSSPMPFQAVSHGMIPAPFQPSASNTPSAIDPVVLAELELMKSEIAGLKKERSKKSNSKKGWETPKWNGRFFLDSVNTADQNTAGWNADGDIQNVFGVRELLLGISGEGYDAFGYKLELSCAPDNGEVDLADAYISAKNLPLFNTLRVGHMKVESGFSHVGSANETTLMEPSGPASPFSYGRRVGIMSIQHSRNETIRLMTGFFAEKEMKNARRFADDDQGWIFNTRLTMTPVFAEEGRRLLHLGVNYSYVKTGYDNMSVMTVQPGAFANIDASYAPRMWMDNEHLNRCGLELIWQHGSFGLASEWYVNAYEGIGKAKDRTARGGYVEARCFLTGDHRSYNKTMGTPGIVNVRRNFHPFKLGDSNLVDGFGAWEAVVQWNYADLTDWRDVDGRMKNGRINRAGQINDFTLGLNWFWTPHLRWVFEYVHSTRDMCGLPDNPETDILATSFRAYF